MKKIFVIMFILVIALSLMSAEDLSANNTTNCNKVILDKWKDMTDITITGIVNAKLLRAFVESITIDKDGFLTVIGKVDSKGLTTDVYQINFFSSNVTINSTTKVDSKTGVSTTLKSMVIKTASASIGKLL